MPQKRNPDAAELVRGHSGRISGAMLALMMTMKGLPLAYSKDMQDDKPPVFEAHDLLVLSLAAMTGMIETLSFDAARMRASAEAGYSTATDLADWLVRAKGIPFREAHHITGQAVRVADEGKAMLWDLDLAQLQAIDPRFDASVFDVLSVDASVRSRTSFGGTAPEAVRTRIAEAKAIWDWMYEVSRVHRRCDPAARRVRRPRGAEPRAGREPAARARDGRARADHRRAAPTHRDRPA